MKQSDIKELMSELGRRSAKATKKKYGKGYSAEMKRRRLSARKKEA